MFKEELSLVPHLPGCYLMKNKDNIVIYVGKSKNLKNRLSSYFQREHTGKTMMLVREIDHFEYIVTNTEMESLLLEINLIKIIIAIIPIKFIIKERNKRKLLSAETTFLGVTIPIFQLQLEMLFIEKYLFWLS